MPGPGGGGVPGWSWGGVPAWSGGTWSQGGVPGWSGGDLVPGGVPAWSGEGGVYLPGLGGYLPGPPPPSPVNRMTNWCKNITLAQTSFAGGNNKILSSLAK